MAYEKYWTWDPDRSDSGVIVDSVAIATPEYRPGKRIRLNLEFWHENPVTADFAETGATAGGTTGMTAGGLTGGTAGSSGQSSDHISRYEEVREYTRWAGRYGGLNTALDGTVRFKDRTPSDATVDSIIVAVEPGPGLTSMPGIWIALDDIDDDPTDNIQDIARLNVRGTVLAQHDEYGSRSALKSAIGGG